MSIEREVILKNEIYTVNSSEMQERMKLYFSLTEEFNKCFKACEKSFFDLNKEEIKKECDNKCDKVYDLYSKMLYNQYKDHPERLDETCEGVAPFYKRDREDKPHWFKRIFTG